MLARGARPCRERSLQQRRSNPSRPACRSRRTWRSHRTGVCFFAEKDTGDIRVIRDGELVARSRSRTSTSLSSSEQGLLGLALDPAFDTQPWIYVYYSDPVLAPEPAGALARRRRRGRTRAAARRAHDRARLPQRRATWSSAATGSSTSPSARCTRLSGPRTRTTWAGRSCASTPTEARRPTTRSARTNPAYSMGHRNSFGLCVDPSTGDLWETENGPGSDDEVNLHPARRQLRLAGPARSGGRAGVHRSGARLPRRDRADRVRRVARATCTSAHTAPTCCIGCRFPLRRTRTPTWWATWAPGSPTSRWDRTAICTSRRPTRSGGSRERVHRHRRRRPTTDAAGRCVERRVEHGHRHRGGTGARGGPHHARSSPGGGSGATHHETARSSAASCRRRGSSHPSGSRSARPRPAPSHPRRTCSGSLPGLCSRSGATKYSHVCMSVILPSSPAAGSCFGCRPP